MFKKLSSLLLIFAMLLSLTVFTAFPVSAVGFSSANWAQYERGLYTGTASFGEYFKEYADTSYGDDQLTAVKMVATTGTALNSNKNPVAYKFGENAAHYGAHQSDTATYAHMRFYLASFSDEYRKATNYLQLRIDKDGTGNSREHYYFDTWVPDGRSDNCTSVYACNYNASTAYVTKDWLDIVHQGRAGNGPASTITANSHQTALTASDYDKIDLIMEYNKQGGATSYLFANGKFMGSYYDSGLTDKHFHGIVIRITASSNSTRSIRNNSDYVAMKFDSDRIGHREYYNTDDYMVTFEDVMQDAGLGSDIDSKMIYKSRPGDLQWYMPGNEQKAYYYPNKLIDGSTPSARVRINENVTYSGTEATIAASNTGSDYAAAAHMLAGLYPINGKTGIAYENYSAKAKYIKLSFDQTIANDGMWLEYSTWYSGKVQAVQMWNNEGNLVVSVKGSGSNITCNGAGNKPTATMTGTNHIDWIMEPSAADECVYHHLYVNGKFVASGNAGNQYAARICDILLSTKNAAGNVKIDNWSMTVYNSEADISDIAAEITGEINEDPEWKNITVTPGEGAYSDTLTVSGTIKNGANLPSGTKIHAAIFGQNGVLLDYDTFDYTNAIETKRFNKSYNGQNADHVKLFAWKGMKPVMPAMTASVLTTEVSTEVMKVKNGAKAAIVIVHDDGSSSTVEYLNREFPKYNLCGTVGIIGTNINTTSKVNNWMNLLNASNGRLNFASHSYNHRYFGESDAAESGTLQDGTSYSYSAGHMSEDIANERARINGLFPNERVLTFIKPGTSYPEGKPQVSDAAMQMIQDHYIAMRNTGGNVDTFPPEDIYSVKSLMAKPTDQGTQYWINLLSSATNKKGLLVYLFHGIKDADTVSGNDVRQSDVSAFFAELANYVADGRVWNAKFDEAMQYASEYGANPQAAATAYLTDGYISVAVTDEISRIDTDNVGQFRGLDMFDYPLTVKVGVPFDWTYVKLTQSYNNRVEIMKTFTENGNRYVYANVVPDKAAAILTEAASSDYISAISYGGTAISGFDPAKFYYKVTLPQGTSSAPSLSCDKAAAVITQASLSSGEGSGFITFGNLRYEVHFSVQQ